MMCVVGSCFVEVSLVFSCFLLLIDCVLSSFFRIFHLPDCVYGTLGIQVYHKLSLLSVFYFSSVIFSLPLVFSQFQSLPFARFIY
jgi:hypothetical protein